jgi:hypothetical protein
MSHRYTYKIEHSTGWFYTGMRTSVKPPAADTKYWGSGTTLEAALLALGKEGWTKTVTGEYETLDALRAAEGEQIAATINDPLCLNCRRSRGCNVTGAKTRYAHVIARLAAFVGTTPEDLEERHSAAITESLNRQVQIMNSCRLISSF